MKKRNEIPSRENLNLILYCDKETGNLYWKDRPEFMFKRPSDAKRWNKRFAGKKAGFTKRFNKSYQARQICINGVHLISARVILVMNGHDPKTIKMKDVDHINGNPQDNRLSNLRVVDKKTNSMNRRKQSNNTSGFTGVKLHKRINKWQAYLKINGKVISLKYHDTPEEAFSAVQAERKKYAFTERHGL